MKRAKIVFLREWRETKSMVKIYLYEKENEVLLKEANKQFFDLIRIFFLIPITLLPGSVVIITVLELIARAFKTTIFPKKQNL